MILAGDVGGTKVDLALYEFRQGKLALVHECKYPAPQYSGLEEIVRQFLGEAGEFGTRAVEAACFGVPGPVGDGKLRLTNLPWELDSSVLSRELNIPHLFLINDLEANGYGIPELSDDQIFTLSAGEPDAQGHRGLVSAGTGLGEAFIIWDGRVHRPVPSEGGHSDFSARTETEIALLRYLLKTLGGRVSWERVVSGIGLKNIYSFLRDDQGMEEPASLRDRMQNEDMNAVIGELGESGESEICSRTLNIFAAAYGAECGNCALKVLTRGGMYLGGGIAPKILKTMQNGAFMGAFTDKGRLSDILVKVPVRILLESRTALIGAAAYAEARATERSGTSQRAASLDPNAIDVVQ